MWANSVQQKHTSEEQSNSKHAVPWKPCTCCSGNIYSHATFHMTKSLLRKVKICFFLKFQTLCHKFIDKLSLDPTAVLALAQVVHAFTLGSFLHCAFFTFWVYICFYWNVLTAIGWTSLKYRNNIKTFLVPRRRVWMILVVPWHFLQPHDEVYICGFDSHVSNYWEKDQGGEWDREIT